MLQAGLEVISYITIHRKQSLPQFSKSNHVDKLSKLSRSLLPRSPSVPPSPRCRSHFRNINCAPLAESPPRSLSRVRSPQASGLMSSSSLKSSEGSRSPPGQRSPGQLLVSHLAVSACPTRLPPLCAARDSLSDSGVATAPRAHRCGRSTWWTRRSSGLRTQRSTTTRCVSAQVGRPTPTAVATHASPDAMAEVLATGSTHHPLQTRDLSRRSNIVPEFTSHTGMT
jgi:hypothetical protein